MTDKRYLFRGFHPDEKGDTTITVDGKEIKGEWVIGYLASGQHIDEYGFCFNHNMRFETFKDRHWVIPETIGQWVTMDKNGKDVFEGDIIKYGFLPNNSKQKGLVGYCEDAYFYIDNGNEYALFMEAYNIQLIGNKWGVRK